MYGHTFMHINNLSFSHIYPSRCDSPRSFSSLNCSGDGWGYVHEQSGLPYDLEQHERHLPRAAVSQGRISSVAEKRPPTYDKTVTVRQLYYNIGYGDCFHVNLVVVATRSIFSKA